MDLFQCLISSYNVKKKVREFPVPSRDVTTNLSPGGNNDIITELFLPRGSLVSDIPAGDGKLVNLFLRCMYLLFSNAVLTVCLMGRRAEALMLNSAAQVASTSRKERNAPMFQAIMPSIPAIELNINM